MMEFEEKIIRIPNAADPPMRPAHDPPAVQHTEEFFNSVELVKPPGRRTKKHTWDFKVTWIPWDVINESELMELCLRDVGLKTDMERWNVIHRGVPRETLIGIILGEVDPEDLPENPIHSGREKLQLLIYENWRHIWSQIGCNTCCWECPDAKALECVLENYHSLPGDRK